MIPSKNNPLRCQPFLCCDREHQLAKIRRPHPRVPALLIYLVRCSLNQQRTAICDRLLYRRAYHPRMCRADGVDASRMSVLTTRREQGLKHGRHSKLSLYQSPGVADKQRYLSGSACNVTTSNGSSANTCSWCASSITAALP